MLCHSRFFINRLRFFKYLFLILNLKVFKDCCLFNNSKLAIKTFIQSGKYVIPPALVRLRFNNFNCIRSELNLELSFSFFYFQSFNRIFEHKFVYFIETFCKLNHIFCMLQYEFSHPNATFLVHLFQKRIKISTAFLKFSKFYYSFLNLMPLVQTFQCYSLLSEQVGFELTRTHKH